MSSLLLFLDISGGELVIIALVIFIVLGPDKLPEIARKFGKAMRYVRSATEDIKREINVDEDIIQKPRNYTYPNKITSQNKVENADEIKEVVEPKQDQNNKKEN